jgi:hypothetical protein
VRVEQLSTVTENLPLRQFVVMDAASLLDINWGIFYWWGTGDMEGTGTINIRNVYLKDVPPV